MSLMDIIILGLALSMDAFAVAVTSGFVMRHPSLRHALKMGLFFGGFQALMPVLGWSAGLALRALIMEFDHWVAFVLLALIGAKMVHESMKADPDQGAGNHFDTLPLLALAVATSIDALAAGVSFAFLRVHIAQAVLVIGGITFSLSFLGVFVGKKFGHFLEHKVKLLGGIVLIAIGVKILIEHLSAA